MTKQNLSIQTLIFPKDKFSRQQALNWAKQHNFKYYTSRIEGNNIRIRQFSPSQIEQTKGMFPIGKTGIKGLYVKKRVYQKYRKNKRGGQHYYVGRRINYSSIIFQKKTPTPEGFKYFASFENDQIAKERTKQLIDTYRYEVKIINGDIYIKQRDTKIKT